MKSISELIKERLIIQNLAERLYCKDYGYLWKKGLYQGNDSFEALKMKYGSIPLTRQMIINLFAEGNYYDGFMCAMIWGGIGNNIKGKAIFNSVFSKTNKKEIVDKLKRVIRILQNGDVKTAYSTLQYSGENKIEGIGESFFTKLLYFAGAKMDSLPIKPLIYDHIMDEAYNDILILTKSKIPNDPFERYEDYCQKMDELCYLLNLPTSGHVEALLFCPGIRDAIFT